MNCYLEFPFIRLVSIDSLSVLGMFSRCIRCHRHTLNGFVSLAGLSLKPSRGIQPLLHNTFPPKYYSKAQRASIFKPNDQGKETAGTVSELETSSTDSRKDHNTRDVEQEFTGKLEEEEATAEQQDAASDVPWYLQENEDIIPPTSLAERQRLPDIPEDAPERIKEVLDRLSLDIGLDYLQLIDLRSLDPPPAIGASVIMIVGTARSEKHLHVSADRFARWLRSAYKLSPRADGLIGRNELKIRLRRRAKRAKLLGSVGATLKADQDDGTRVGWICVDSGMLDPSSTEEKSLNDSGVIGFGSPTSGTKLVVQMMTEDKRRELDLESLWDKAFERQRKRLAKREEATEFEDTDQELR